MAQQRDQACGKLDHAHDSLRLDGTLDNCCLRCGADGYWHDGRRLDEPHPSGKLLFRLGMLRPGFADFTLGELLLLGLWVIGQEDRVRTDSPNPLSVWRAELHDVRDGYAFRLLCTGVSEGDALDRLDKLIAEIRGADA
jgi:hypothetical protein